ncbi:MAG TPA: NAD(P)/FAD-dependent oxidoreductase [Acidimicrobiales bacterium]|jgi:dihydrolipoamide dehydrogenase|nr:NAD(P)/FAD-dependent oxidoreductase [Acidimicrobiales bacterium]
MASAHEFDVVVIGAGPVGENVADRAVQGGLTAAIVESELVGGECSYWACMPSKALIRPVQARTEARSVAGSRQAVTGPLDVAAVLGRRDSFTSHWDDAGQVEWLDGAHIALFRGHGRLLGPRRVQAGDAELTARHAVVIATGTAAAIPPVPGLAEAGPWTSREATSAKEAPGRLIILGGGVVGCEMAQAWAALGSRVTLVERSDHLLAGHEPFAGQMVAAAMSGDGIDVRTGRLAQAVTRPGGTGPVTVTLDDGSEVEGDEVLVAAGRRPQTGDVGLETVGLEPGSWLEVDDSMRVRSVGDGWLYAAGDVNHRALLTHQGKYQARICGDVIAARAKGSVTPAEWDRYSATADHAAVPAVVFTSPEVAGVGLTASAAQAAGLDIRVVEIPIAVAGSSLFADEYEGRAAMVVDETRRVVVGATFVGPGVAELLHSATVAVVGQVPLERLWHAVPSYPTISEVWLRLLESYGL